jgi:hypothetical protein
MHTAHPAISKQALTCGATDQTHAPSCTGTGTGTCTSASGWRVSLYWDLLTPILVRCRLARVRAAVPQRLELRAGDPLVPQRTHARPRERPDHTRPLHPSGTRTVATVLCHCMLCTTPSLLNRTVLCCAALRRRRVIFRQQNRCCPWWRLACASMPKQAPAPIYVPSS